MKFVFVCLPGFVRVRAVRNFQLFLCFSRAVRRFFVCSAKRLEKLVKAVKYTTNVPVYKTKAMRVKNLSKRQSFLRKPGKAVGQGKRGTLHKIRCRLQKLFHFAPLAAFLCITRAEIQVVYVCADT